MNKTLFYNRIRKVKYTKITNINDLSGELVTLSKPVITNIKQYVQDLIDHKISTCVSEKQLKRYIKRDNNGYWRNGFAAEYAVVQLLKDLGVKISFDDTPRAHNVGDNGDIHVTKRNGDVVIIDIKSTDKINITNHYRHITPQKLKADYYLFTQTSYVDDIFTVNIIGYKSREEVQPLPIIGFWTSNGIKKGRKVDFSSITNNFDHLIKTLQD